MIILTPEETGCRLPIKVWPPGFESDDAVNWFEQYDHDVFQQFRNLANHPIARKWVCGMPDYHLGYGMPIGGVLATSGGVVPSAVGVDIGCGMKAVQTSLLAEQLTPDHLERVRLAIHERVPVGFERHKELRSMPVELMKSGLESGLGEKWAVVGDHFERARSQLGTLGGGNHFIELQRDAKDGRLWVMLHSGSRNIGKQVCDHYSGLAREYMSASVLKVDRDLAYLPIDSEPYDHYLAEMHWCMKYAEANRNAMMEAVWSAFEAVLGKGTTMHDMEVNTHHNFAARELHFGEHLWIHRKGAVKAEGLVTIPGSMGTASYIARGLRPTESFNTCSHGAGRRMGRKQAKREISHDRAVESMGNVVYPIKEGDYDEMPDAYKSIDAVMAAQEDLVTAEHRLLPLTVVKG